MLGIFGLLISISYSSSCEEMCDGGIYDYDDQCYCDDVCHYFYDCCDDYSESCSDELTCEEMCDGGTYDYDAGCYCDDVCQHFHDCCGDYSESCVSESTSSDEGWYYCIDANICENNCGNPMHGCWCDDECIHWEDCCCDYFYQCL